MNDVAVPGMELDYSVESDEVTLVRIARADPAAFGELYKRYLARIHSYMRSRAHSAEDAADLTEQVFQNALVALPKYQNTGVPFAAWLFRIARNVATDAHRRKRPTTSWDVLPESLHPSDGEDPEVVVLRREATARVREMLAGLEPDKRELLMLRFVADLTLREIASVVGKSESHVHKQLTVTLQSLKERSHEE